MLYADAVEFERVFEAVIKLMFHPPPSLVLKTSKNKEIDEG
jgi:hypothetical protein